MTFAPDILLRGCRRNIGALVYVCRGRTPGARGYSAYRDAYIRRSLNDPRLIENFAEGRRLPRGMGLRLDERAVEYPWIVSRLKKHTQRGRMLDAGSTLNNSALLAHSAMQPHQWTILTLAPESEASWKMGVSYVYDDLRQAPFRDDWFDAVCCISVLEHVGMDNLLYAGENSFRERHPQDYLAALLEMKRVLKPGGWLYLTVPFGRYEDHRWFQQFDSAMLASAIAHFAPQASEKVFYRYAPDGWNLAQEEECGDLPYFDIHAEKFPGGDARLKPSSASAVAASAVACVGLRK